jgi:TetR/AcrR family transcriptional repressor of nem operon
MGDTKYESKTTILDAAMHVIRTKVCTATRIEDICAEASLTKGAASFITLQVRKIWRSKLRRKHRSLFAAAPFKKPRNPLDRVWRMWIFARNFFRTN